MQLCQRNREINDTQATYMAIFQAVLMSMEGSRRVGERNKNSDLPLDVANHNHFMTGVDHHLHNKVKLF